MRAGPALACLSLLVSGCAATLADSTAAGQASGLHRVHVSKSPGKPPVVTSQPILTHSEHALPEPAAPAPAQSSAPRPEPLAITYRTGEVPVSKPERLSFGLEGGADAVMIFSHLRTTFRAPASSDLDWDDTIVPSGTGFHASLAVGPASDEFLFALSGGGFASSRESHSGRANGVFARETLDTHCAWASVEARYYPPALDFTFLKAALGTFVYSVDSHLETNAPSFEYDGLSGTRAMGALGLGTGLKTPWDFPLQASVEGTWWLADKQSPPIESGVGQISASLLLRF